MLAAGCAATSTPVPPKPSVTKPSVTKPSINLSGYPPAFRQGYTDGCASAGERVIRDEARFKGDVQYAWGWRDGRDICRKKGS